MALRSTVFRAQLAVADIDHGYYADHALTLARHPSETDERMMIRLAALALNAHRIQTDCGGDATIGFGAGLSDPDDPDVFVRDFTGRIRTWIEVGQPEDRPVTKACGKADHVIVYPYASSADVWWRAIQGKLARSANLEVMRFPAAASQQLAQLAQRSMQLQATIQDGALTVSHDSGTVGLEPERWK